MATIKAFTTIKQSRKLAEILPIESADMCYEVGEDLDGYITKTIYTPLMHTPYNDDYIPCWSLAALLKLLPKSAQLKKGNATELYRVTLPVELESSDWYVEPIGACYELILKLHKLKMRHDKER